ncbi:MAG: hypothetical protein ACOYCD_04895 [Kiritimatiellia bacterium]|jgi:succinate dehydrogenase hydrophobic anchor subunit
MKKIKISKSDARNGNAQVVTAVIMAALALVMLGVVLYMQYAEQSYYQEPPSVWPSTPATSVAPAAPPSDVSTVPSGLPDTAGKAD